MAKDKPTSNTESKTPETKESMELRKAARVPFRDLESIDNAPESSRRGIAIRPKKKTPEETEGAAETKRLLARLTKLLEAGSAAAGRPVVQTELDKTQIVQHSGLSQESLMVGAVEELNTLCAAWNTKKDANTFRQIVEVCLNGHVLTPAQFRDNLAVLPTTASLWASGGATAPALMQEEVVEFVAAHIQNLTPQPAL